MERVCLGKKELKPSPALVRADGKLDQGGFAVFCPVTWKVARRCCASAEGLCEFNQRRGPVILRSLLTVLPLIAMEPRSAQPDTAVCSGVLGVVVKPKLTCLCQENSARLVRDRLHRSQR